jgi:tRNA pseudouridine38-40 synthase
MRIALGIEYDGTDFYGWQRLGHGPSVQAAVEQALSFVADEAIEVTCAGRTDSGVHALCQVVHFDTAVQRSERSWILGANSNLPPSVAVRWAKTVPDEFHARFGALARRYRYVIVNRAVRPALEGRYVTWERARLDVDPMRDAAQSLIGEHDFNAFRSIACQANTSMRNVHEIILERVRDRIEIQIQANAFLHHMVRNIVGSLLPIGRGERPIEWMAELLHGKDRTRAGATAPATGLSFLFPLYPDQFGLPEEVTLR